MESKILQSVVEITRQRDLDSFEYSLVATLAELVPVTEIAILKTIHENRLDKLNIAVGLNVVTDDAGEQICIWADGRQVISADEKISSCLQSFRPSIHRSSDGHMQLLSRITCDGRIIGAFSIKSKEGITDYLPIIDGFLRIYHNYIIIFNESECDKLTGLYNRRTFDKRLQRLINAQAECQQQIIASGQMAERRNKKPDACLWMAIFDIDHFKQVNDAYGHVYGDEVILTISQILKGCFRSTDLKFRIGGEEFVIVLEPATFEKTTELLENFREAIANHRFSRIGTVTVSIGFAKLTNKDYPPVKLECADKALYYAKEHGRNCVYCYESLLEDGELAPPEKCGVVDLF